MFAMREIASVSQPPQKVIFTMFLILSPNLNPSI